MENSVECLSDDLVKDGIPKDEAPCVVERAATIGEVRRGSRIRAPKNPRLPGEEDDNDNGGYLLRC